MTATLRSVSYRIGAPAGTTFLSTFAWYPSGLHVPRVICRVGAPSSSDHTPCATQSRISSRCCSPLDISSQSVGRSKRPMSRRARNKSIRLRMFCRATASRPSAVVKRSAVYAIWFSSCSMAAKTAVNRPISRKSIAGSLSVLNATGTNGWFMMTPNVRAKRATTAGRQGPDGENVPRTTGRALVACRWRSA